MKKLDKVILAQRDEIAGRLRDRFTDLESAVEEFNTQMDEAWAKLETAIGSYNEVVGDANSWKTDVAGQIQEYIDGKSEKWQEGEAAQRYEAWKSPFDEQIDAVELEKPDNLESDVEDAAEALEQLPEEL